MAGICRGGICCTFCSSVCFDLQEHLKDVVFSHQGLLLCPILISQFVLKVRIYVEYLRKYDKCVLIRDLRGKTLRELVHLKIMLSQRHLSHVSTQETKINIITIFIKYTHVTNVRTRCRSSWLNSMPPRRLRVSITQGNSETTLTNRFLNPKFSIPSSHIMFAERIFTS